MELTIQQFEQFDSRLQAVNQGQRDLEREIAGVYIRMLLV